MATATEATLSEVIAGATARLRAAGVPSPRHDAERLVARATGLQWQDLWSRLRQPLPAAEPVDALVARRAGGEPLAYILGTTVFYGLELEVGPGVLVPRPETETVVDVALQLGPHAAVADVGTGTGAIAVALATHLRGSRVWASDVSGDALGYARRNVARHGPDVSLARCDLLAGVPRGLDLVVSNPPYVADGTAVPPDVGAEPEVAVFGGPTGDEVALRLIAQAEQWLRPGGHLVIEIGTPDQAARLRRRLSGWRRAATTDDHSGRQRVVWAEL